MSDEPKCTTHHYACDCREWMFAKLRAQLAESKRHSDWQSEKITSLQDKVDGFSGVYNELADAQRQVTEWRKIADDRRTRGLAAEAERDALREQIDIIKADRDYWMDEHSKVTGSIRT